MRRGDPSIAVGYVRSSTKEQRLGPEVQQSALAAWAKASNVRLVAVFEEVVSGRTSPVARDGLSAALAAVRSAGAGKLVAYRRCRFARDAVAAAQLTALVRRLGAELAVVEGVQPGNSPEARLVQGVVDLAAEFEVDQLRRRTSEALRQKLAKGEAAGGTAPLGQKIVRGRLVDCPEEQAALARAAELRASGLSWPRVTSTLRAEGFRPRGSAWHAAPLVRALRRASTT